MPARIAETRYAPSGKSPLEIPVYLADSIMTPSRGGYDLFEQEKVCILLSVGKVEIPRRLATQQGVATVVRMFDRHLEEKPPTPPAEFLKTVRKDLVGCGAQWEQDGEVVGDLYKKLQELDAAGRNGLWASPSQGGGEGVRGRSNTVSWVVGES